MTTNFARGVPRGGPRRRWRGQHCGARNGPDKRYWKRAHASWWRAALHAWRRNRTQPDREKIRPYPCRWGDDPQSGETAREHWHVGHMPKDDWWGY